LQALEFQVLEVGFVIVLELFFGHWFHCNVTS
jgi:hypothetical protein